MQAIIAGRGGDLGSVATGLVTALSVGKVIGWHAVEGGPAVALAGRAATQCMDSTFRQKWGVEDARCVATDAFAVLSELLNQAGEKHVNAAVQLVEAVRALAPFSFI